MMVSLRDGLLTEIDEGAKRRSTTRSALLAAGARRELQRPDPEAFDRAVAESEERFADAGPFEAADLIRWTRDSSPR